MWSLLVLEPVDVVSGGCIGLLAPLDFVGNVMLGIVPGVVSLGVWGDVGVAVLNWIDHSSSLNY